jgi:glycosyltransferase involved in cell wall biosynthesis
MISEEISLILPTKNHEKIIINNINLVIKYLKNNFSNFEILIISNDSEKENIDLIKEYDSLQINHLVYQKSGKGFAVREGIRNSSFKNVVICDADFSVSVECLNDFFRKGKPISGFVVGSRKLRDSQTISTPLIRKISGGIFTFLTKYYLKVKITDTQCGFKLIDKSIFINCDKYLSDDFYFDVELFLLAKKDKVKVTEVPVQYVHNNRSSVNLFSDSLRMLFKLLNYKYKHR